MCYDVVTVFFLIVSNMINSILGGCESMQAKQADGARRSVHDVLEYLNAIPEVKEAIKKDD